MSGRILATLFTLATAGAGCAPLLSRPEASAGPAAASLCRASDGRLRDALYSPIRRLPRPPGDSVVDPGPSAEYAGTRGWYANHEIIVFGGTRFVQFGVPRTFTPDPLPPGVGSRIERVGSHDGVPVYVDPSLTDLRAPDQIMLLASRGCIFQSYVDYSKLIPD